MTHPTKPAFGSKTEAEKLENPYEQFVVDHVQFDAKGHANVVSLHGLARLLQWFHKEVVQNELSQARLEGVREGKEFIGKTKREWYQKGARKTLLNLKKEVYDLYDEKYSHITRDYRAEDELRDDIAGTHGIIEKHLASLSSEGETKV